MAKYYMGLTEANEERQKLWSGSDKVNYLFRTTEFMGEAGELANAVKKLYRAKNGVVGNVASDAEIMENLYDEIGDVIISLDLLVNSISEELGIDKIDIAQCIVDKFNKTSKKNNIPVYMGDPNVFATAAFTEEYHKTKCACGKKSECKCESHEPSYGDGDRKFFGITDAGNMFYCPNIPEKFPAAEKTLEDVATRREDEIMIEVANHIKNTYNEHYISGENGKEVETLDVWESLGTLESTSRDIAIKYLMRYGKKDGRNKKDLFKAIHFIVLMIYCNENGENLE